MKTKNFFFPVIIVFVILLAQSEIYSGYDQEKAFTYIQQLYNQQDKKTTDFLIAELESYLKTFPQSQHRPEVMLMLGKVHEQKGHESNALASYLKNIFLYPDNEKTSETRENIRQLIGNERKFAEERAFIINAAESTIASDSTADRFYAYLEICVQIDEKDFNKTTLKSLRDFLSFFPSDNRTEQVQIWIGDVYAQNSDEAEADLSYAKFIELFPESPLMPQLLYRRGILQYRELKRYEEAIATLQKIREEYPESEYAADGLMLSGEISEKKKRDYQAAISDYRMVIDDYPQSPKMLDALWKIAEINKDKLKEYPTAILAFNKIIEIDTTNQISVQALEEIGEIYEKKLKDYEQAAATYLTIGETYSDYADAPDRLMDAGEIYEKKLDNNEQAMKCYQMIIEKYGEHKKARDAAKKIEKLKEKMGQDEPGKEN